MEFLSAPLALEALGVSTTSLIVAAIVVPLLVGALMGLEREFAVIAACAGVLAALLSGA